MVDAVNLPPTHLHPRPQPPSRQNLVVERTSQDRFHPEDVEESLVGPSGAGIGVPESGSGRDEPLLTPSRNVRVRLDGTDDSKAGPGTRMETGRPLWTFLGLGE